MSEKQKLVIVISRGLDDERSSVAWSIANAGVASDMEVTVFLVAAGVDWVRKGAAEVAHLNP
ncbi:MAG: peroxiredoxin, partial [Gammaproteobacteria bacterium]|nr:peroxiredoxin [Gammaproteobacteria bacterium]